MARVDERLNEQREQWATESGWPSGFEGVRGELDEYPRAANEALDQACSAKTYAGATITEAVIATDGVKPVDPELFDEIASNCLDGADVSCNAYRVRRVKTGVGLGSERYA